MSDCKIKGWKRAFQRAVVVGRSENIAYKEVLLTSLLSSIGHGNELEIASSVH
jgi:hypothetical protein